jgi:L-alanine-DL-glutamate epimerase-like enolase superfamily enzyme
MVRSMEPLVVGADPTTSAGIWQRGLTELNFYGRKGLAIMGLAAIDTALWDLRAKQAEINVARLIGMCRPAMPTYASSGLWLSSSIEELQKEAEAFMARGFRAMKMRLGHADPATDIARVRAVRDVIGPGIALMADANQQMDVGRAIRLGRMLEEFNLTWFEEPVPHQDHAGEAAIAAALDTPIASGETEYTSAGMLEMLRMRSADILMPDLQRMGGATEFLRAAHVAYAFDTSVSSHLYSEMSLPLLASLPNAIFLEHMDWFEPMYREHIELDANGHAIVPDRPGWGFALDEKAISRLAPA